MSTYLRLSAAVSLRDVGDCVCGEAGWAGATAEGDCIGDAAGDEPGVVAGVEPS